MSRRPHHPFPTEPPRRAAPAGARLTAGAVAHAATHGMLPVGECLLQITDIGKVPAAGPQRVPVTLSDGEYTADGVLEPAFAAMVLEGELAPLALVRVTEAAVSRAPALQIAVRGFTVDSDADSVGRVLGSPQPWAGGGSSSRTAVPAAPRPAAPPAAARQAAPAAASPATEGAEVHPTFGPVMPINSLVPVIRAPTIKVRVVQREPERTWNKPSGSGKVLNVVLVDAWGGKIRASLFNKALDRFGPMLHEHGVYYMHGFRIKLANRSFRVGTTDYELEVSETSSVEEAAEEADIPELVFQPVPIRDIERHAKGDTIDVMGVVTHVGELRDIATSEGAVLKREVCLLDTDTTINLTLWRAAATDTHMAEGDVLVATGVRVGDFGGRSLSTGAASRVVVNPPDPRAQELADWFRGQSLADLAAQARSLTTISAPCTVLATLGQAIETSDRLWHHARAVHDDKVKAEVYVQAAVTDIRTDTPLCLPFCNTAACKRARLDRVVSSTGLSFRCPQCGAQTDSPAYRYQVRVTLSAARLPSADAPLSADAAPAYDTMDCMVFDQEAEALVGVPPAEAAACGDDEEARLALVESRHGLEFLFRLRLGVRGRGSDIHSASRVTQALPLQAADALLASLLPVHSIEEIPGVPPPPAPTTAPVDYHTHAHTHTDSQAYPHDGAHTHAYGDQATHEYAHC